MMVSSRVVFPEPLGPKRMKVSPGLMLRSMPLSTGAPWIETCRSRISSIMVPVFSEIVQHVGVDVVQNVRQR